MQTRARRTMPSPALVIATIALFAALGGAAYAVTLGKNDVKSRNIAPKAVKGSEIATGAVKSPKIGAGAVTSVKLASGAVGPAALADAAVERQKIKAQAVTTPKIADAAVETAKLGDGAVTAAKLGPGSVTSAAALASLVVSVDPPSGPDACARATAAVSGAADNDHVVVTAPSAVADQIVATGDVSTGQIGVRVCTESATNPDPINFNVLVIG